MTEVAFVTGASRGIGKAVCAHLALAGYDIVLAARSIADRQVTPFPGTIGETAALVERLGATALPVACDVTDNRQIDQAVEQAKKTFGRIDLLVLNARYEGPAQWRPFSDIPWDEVDRLVRCNVLGPLYLTARVLPIMRRRRRGMIFGLTSVGARQESPNLPDRGATSLLYGSSKAALERALRGLVKEVREDNIAVVNVDPGGTLTERATADPSTHGFSLEGRHSVHVPAACMAFIATCADPMAFTGRLVEARRLVREHFLMSPEDLRSPFRPGEMYDPYQERYWLDRVSGRAGR